MRKVLYLLLILSLVFSPMSYAKTPWKSKPPIGSVVDWSHPLAKGLVGCWLMNEGGGTILKSLIKQDSNLLANGNNFGSSPLGAGFKTNASGKYAKITTPSSLKLPCPITIFYYGWSYGSPSSNSSYFGVTYGGTDSAPYESYQFQYRDGSPNKLSLLYNDGTNIQFDACSTVAPPVNGKLSMVGIVGKGVLYFYINGKLIVSATRVGLTSPAYSSTSQIVMGTGIVTTRNPSATALIGAIWNRALSPTEIRQLYIDPYCFIKQPSLYDLFKAAVAGAGRTIFIQ